MRERILDHVNDGREDLCFFKGAVDRRLRPPKRLERHLQLQQAVEDLGIVREIIEQVLRAPQTDDVPVPVSLGIVRDGESFNYHVITSVAATLVEVSAQHQQTGQAIGAGNVQRPVPAECLIPQAHPLVPHLRVLRVEQPEALVDAEQVRDPLEQVAVWGDGETPSIPSKGHTAILVMAE